MRGTQTKEAMMGYLENLAAKVDEIDKRQRWLTERSAKTGADIDCLERESRNLEKRLRSLEDSHAGRWGILAAVGIPLAAALLFCLLLPWPK